MAATVRTIVIHALILGIIIIVIRRDLQRGRVGVRFWMDLTFITNVTLFAFAGHIIEIGFGPGTSSLRSVF